MEAAGFDGRTLGPYELGKTLGQGAQGKVKLALDGNGDRHALKIIKIEAINSERARQNLMNEIEALGKVQHPNVLSLLDGPHEGEYPRKNGQTRPVLYFSTEVCPTELFNVLMHTGPFSDVVARAYSQQLLSALAACKERGICHRDIKPENLMIDEHYRLKVVDFGLAHIFPHEQPRDASQSMFAFEDHAEMCRTRVGTPQYMAPAVIERREYSGFAADMWSAGCIIFTMLAGHPPFSEARASDWWFQRVLEGDFDSFWSAHERQARFSTDAKDLLQQMFEPTDEHRITVEQALAHRWLREQEDDIGQEALAAELQRRIRTVTREQEAERRANPPRGSSYDDAPAARVMRGPGGAAAESRDSAAALSAPVLKRAQAGGFVDGHGFAHNQLIAYYTRKSARQTLDRLHQALDMINAKHSINEDAVTIKGKIVVPSASISFTLSVFDIGDGLHLIEVNRIKGPSLKFHEVYAKIGEKLDDILVTPPDIAGAVEEELAGAEEAKREADAGGRHK